MLFFRQENLLYARSAFLINSYGPVNVGVKLYLMFIKPKPTNPIIINVTQHNKNQVNAFLLRLREHLQK